jgi:hypothetical protein
LGAFVFGVVVFAVVSFGAFVAVGEVALGPFGAVVVFASLGAFDEEAVGPFGPFDAASSGAVRVKTIAMLVAIFTKRIRVTSRARGRNDDALQPAGSQHV